MRIFSGLKEGFKEIQRDLVEMGTEIHPSTYQDQDVSKDPQFMTKELQGYCYAITSRDTLIKDFLDLGGNLGYAAQEVLDRTSSRCLNPGSAWEHRKEIWEPFLHRGKFAYTYNERIRYKLPIIIEELRQRPNTRQAVLSIYEAQRDMIYMGGKARIPCSMYYQFLIRERQGRRYLDIIYTMRSCDLYTHFIYDVFITMGFQEYIADRLCIKPGHFTHFIGSLHAYKKDYEKLGIF